MRPLAIANSYDSMQYQQDYAAYQEAEDASSAHSWPSLWSHLDSALLKSYDSNQLKPESILKQDVYEPRVLYIPPSDVSLEDRGVQMEEIEHTLLETMTEVEQYAWRKVQIRCQHQTSWYEQFFPDATPPTKHFIKRLLYPSDEEFNYKLTRIYEPEPVAEEVLEEESIYSFPSWHPEDTLTMSSSAGPTEHMTPILSTIILDDIQVKKLTSLLNMGVDINNTHIEAMLEPVDSSISYDLDAIISYNAMIPIDKLIPSYIYPVDKTGSNPSVVANMVSKYIDLVLSLNPMKHKSESKDLSKLIKEMKPLVLPMSETLKPQKTVEAVKQTQQDETLRVSETCKTDITGYRNKTNNAIYYNACSQTYRVHDDENRVLVSREAQTPALPLLDSTSATVETKATQMEREDYYIDNKNDRIICPGPYQPHIHGPGLLNILATRIQRAWRQYLIRRTNAELKRLLEELQRNEKKKRYVMQESVSVRQMRAMLSPMFLSKRQDYHMLYLFLENWWRIRKDNADHKKALCILQNIKRTSCNDHNKALASRVLKGEYDELLKYLINIEKVTTQAKGKGDRRDMAELVETTKPVTITVKNVKSPQVEIETIESRRGAYLKGLYNTLRQRDQCPGERIQFLREIGKFLLDENKELELTERLLGLINKEIDYLKHCVKPEQMESLRQRIELHFLKYIRSKHVNPNMNKIIEKRCPPNQGHNLLRCEHCLKVKSADLFETEGFSDNVLPVCKACHHLYVIANKFEDHSKYTAMLEFLRQEELRYCTLSPVPFLINENTVHYLVFNIWGSQSAISNSSDIIQLRLARWIIHLDWTPWNNIVLTEEEYESHIQVKNVHSIYSPAFIRKVELRNKRARMYFENLYKMEYQMKSMFWLQGDTLQEVDMEELVQCDDK